MLHESEATLMHKGAQLVVVFSILLEVRPLPAAPNYLMKIFSSGL
jgi:hypothetical protein